MTGTTKILIGIPMHEPDERFLSSLSEFTKQLDGYYNYEVMIVGGKQLVEAQNIIAEQLMKGDYTHLLTFEDDHWGFTKEMLDALMKPNVDVCAMNYYCRWYPYNSCLMEEIYPDKPNKRFAPIQRSSGYAECDLTGFGMTLYKRKVFEVIPKPYFTLNKRGERYFGSYATDEDFCDRLKTHGIKLMGCWDYVVAHRDITGNNVGEIREKATIKFHEIIRLNRITGKHIEVTEDMLKEPSFSELDNRHKGQVCYIVGKGPSVQYLDASYFPTNGPIIAINETYKKVESLNLTNPVYSLQKDLGFGIPDKATLLVHCWEESSQFAPFYRPRYEFDCEKLGLIKVLAFSATVAIRIAQIMGCRDLKFLSFDSCTTGDYRTQNFDDTITIPYNKTAYHNQRAIQEGMMYAAKLNFEYITPGIKEGIITDEENKVSMVFS